MSPCSRFPVSVDVFLRDNRLFPMEITQNPWVAFHGTSSVCEQQIESHGLYWQPISYQRRQIEAIIRIFRSMNWAEFDLGGFGVLSTFTAGDFSGKEKKPIFLAETDARATLFATVDFAGGETARAVRKAIDDLDRFMKSRELREQDYEQQKKACIDLIKVNGLPSRVIRVNITWLGDQINALHEIRKSCEDLKNTYRYGVIYAVRFKTEDLPYLAHSWGTGLQVFRKIDPDRILGKVHLSSKDCNEIYRTYEGNQASWSEKHQRPNSVYKAVSKRGGTEAKEHRRQTPLEVTLDPEVGEDHAPDLVKEFGTEEYKESMRQNPEQRSTFGF